MAERDLDILVYGASGFVGRQVVQYLAASADGRGLRVGLGGRDRAKLEAVRVRAGVPEAAILVADSADQAACDAAVGRARVVLDTAGPFARYGTPIVDACVRLGTHYVDITGETWWIRSLIDRYHDRAAADGTRIVPTCGFDSVPSDLGAFYAVRHALGGAARGVNAYFQLFGGVNGGTLASMLEMGADRARMEALRDPLLLNPPGARSAEERARNRDPLSARYDPDAGAWTGPFFMGPINTRVVRRSAALFAEWGEPYGSGFRYQEYMKYPPLLGPLGAIGGTAGSAFFMGALEVGPVRRALQAVLPKPGTGPSQAAIDSGWFTCDLVVEGEDGRKVRAVFRDRGDPGNRVTAKCVSEAALAIALEGDALPGGAARGGVLTPATALGDVLVRRLQGAGMTLEARS
jgi:short subunit dehydrogenase-like uncharacterized protein